MNNIHQQRGIVLIGMMIIVTLAWKQQHENFKLSKYTQTQQQALNYVYAMESWAKVILLNDKNTKVDTLDED
ncbi:type II secretion system protein GspK [Abyssogena phaseoliformis symbiont]|uniref:type II secretion system protein GspK n=1 Tax=Abyssogena phaseoliformis symbiont TaxID=596095 RepID=UPI001915094C|nr:type II secretion system protein GspK [Abyssogena phaseoliformis symbiont]